MAAKGGNAANKKMYDALLGSLKNPNSSTASHVIKLKKKLGTKEKAINFISENLTVYKCLLDSMKSAVYRLTMSESPEETNYELLVKELISLIANLCHFSIACSTMLKNHLIGFEAIALRILESGERTGANLKSSMLRLLGNLAEYRDTASILTQPNLLERIAIMISVENTQISDAALRTIRLLSKHKGYVRHIILASVLFNIGLLLTKRDLQIIFKDTNLLIILEQLSKYPDTYVRDFGRQLAQGRCTEKFLEIILEEPNERVGRWQLLILKLTKISCDLREECGQNAIKTLISKQKVNRCIILFLSYFSCDVWARKCLRIEGALVLILAAQTTLLDEQAQIVAALKFFIYDPEGSSIICHRNEITNVCIQSMNYFIENSDNKHSSESSEYYGEEDQMENAVRGDSTPARIDFFEKKHINPQFSKYTVSSPSSNSCASQSQSPMSSYSLSPSPSTSPLRTVEDIISMSIQPPELDNLPVNSEDESISNKNDTNSLHKTIVSDCIEIFAWQTHRENAAEFLINEPILRTFLRFLSEVPSMTHDRLLRLFRRILQSRLYLHRILDIRFTIMAVLTLLRRPCILKRFCSPCTKCFECTGFGQEILSELIAQTDSAFGIGILEQHCSYTDSRFIYSLLNGLVLLRLVDNRNRFIQRWRPVQTVLERVSNILLNETPEQIKDNQLLIEIFGMLSLLVSKRYINKLIGPSEPCRQSFDSDCTLEAPSEDEPQVEFVTNARHMISISTSDLSKTNAYFQGMIRHEMSSGTKTKLTFLFDSDKDQVDEEDFLKFLHYLAGCREKSCVRVQDAKTCVALLHLSDKYSCIELGEELLRSNGAARKFIDGSNIDEFLPVILSSWLFRDRFGFILAFIFLKFTNEMQQKQVFSVLGNNQVGIEYFTELISNFLNSVDKFTSRYRVVPLDFV